MTTFSQPADSGTGQTLVAQVYHARQHLKDKDRPMTFDALWTYLSIPGATASDRAQFKQVLESGRVPIIYDPAGFDGKGSFRYKAPHDVRDPEGLKNYLHRQPSMLGIPVKELKDGWADCGTHLDALEATHDILVLRNRKNPEARVVWVDDPNLFTSISAEFRDLWNQVQLPANPEDIRAKLQSRGIKATTERKVVGPAVPEKTKKKGIRKGAKQTNLHMTHVLKDYSHLRK